MPAFELSQICGDATSSVDIVFVHGLTGHAMRTWGQNDDSPVRPAIWPAALCDASARVWLAGYPSPLLDVFHGGKLGQLFMEEGKEALRCLQEHKLGEKPILFVAHSLGGLLVKALLCKSETERKDDQTAGRPSIVDATAGVVFLATPHAGSDRVAVRYLIPHLIKLFIAVLWFGLGRWVHATWLSTTIVSVGTYPLTAHRLLFEVVPAAAVALAIWLLRPARHVKLLDPANAELRDLRDGFRALLRNRPNEQRPMAVLAMYETLPMRWWGIPLGILVSWSSADPGIADCTPEPFTANHVDICKPEAVKAYNLIERLKELVEYATSGDKTYVFSRSLQGLLNQTDDVAAETKELLKQVVKSGNFSDIPTENRKRQRVEAEVRRWVRQGIQKGLLRPEAWRLRMAAISSFQLDQFLRAIWFESRLTDDARVLIAHAEKEFDTWPDGNGEWPTLIPFYRALRTLDSGRNSEDAKLLKMIAEAYDRLNQAQDKSNTPPDATGATRWLLFRMECVGRLASAGISFVGDHDREHTEPPQVTRAREQMREGFSEAVVQLEEFLAEVRRKSLAPTASPSKTASS